MGTTPKKSHWPIIGPLIHRFRNWAQARSSLSDLSHTGTAETARVAHDLGLSASELANLADRGPDAADLLPQRLSALHLDAKELGRTEPATLRDMQRLCTMCESKGRCAADLADPPADPAWRQYCPNAATLDALKGG